MQNSRYIFYLNQFLCGGNLLLIAPNGEVLPIGMILWWCFIDLNKGARFFVDLIDCFASFANDFKKGFDDDNMDWLARVDWKYACSVGTSGTPFPYINRVFFDGAIYNYNLTDWKAVIDPMLANDEKTVL